MTPNPVTLTGCWLPPVVLIKNFLALIIAAILAACAPVAVPTSTIPSPKLEAKRILSRTTFSMLPGWTEDRHTAALPAFVLSCAKLDSLPGNHKLGAGSLGGSVADWKNVCAAAGQVPSRNARAIRSFFETWFVPYLVTNNGDPEGLFTGYYEAELNGAWSRRGRYQTPIYAPPPDIVSVDLGKFRNEWKGNSISGRVVGSRLTPLETRAEIEKGALAGKGLEIVWVDDPVEAFFLHIQGSGRVVMENGEVLRLGFAGRNGHAYMSIGRELVKSGAIPKKKISMQTIHAWLRAHPKKGAALMARNPSYIFFRVIKGKGPIGAQGVALTPGRSLAVDKRFVPF
ncbi:MAG TPA: murein transglycosylase, partial [Rhodospirillales bacterium]|nr:murein transglycosylase [Rhodospirillales bacterium]